MKVFISWSGELSRQIAESLKSWLQYVVQATEPWISTQDIDKGSLWFSEINDQLDSTSVGIICLTRENLASPWIHFEAGALLKGLRKNRVCTLLIGLRPSDLQEPLSKFHATVANKTDMLKLVQSINKELVEKALPKEILTGSFERFWPEFHESMSKIIKDYKPITRHARDTKELVEEILQVTRQTQSALETMRQEQQLEKDAREAAAKYARTFGLVNAFGAGAFGTSPFGEGLGILDPLAMPPSGSAKIGATLPSGSAKISTTPPTEAKKSESEDLYGDK